MTARLVTARREGGQSCSSLRLVRKRSPSGGRFRVRVTSGILQEVTEKEEDIPESEYVRREMDAAYYAGLDRPDGPSDAAGGYHSEEGDERVETVRKALGHYEFSVEAVLDLDSLTASLAAAERERDELQASLTREVAGSMAWYKRAEAAEARVAALEAAWARIQYLRDIGVDPDHEDMLAAEAALAAGGGTEGKS